MKSLTAGWLLLAAWLLSAAASSAPGELTPTEKQGQSIYLLGESPSGARIIAALSQGSQVPASILPCVNCHGHDGKGRAEGGVYPSDLTWDALTKPYGVSHPSGRKFPPYNERLLKRAITLGLDPAGNRLHATMPRYRLTSKDADALVAYLKRLGSIREPGLDDTAITVGSVLPPASKGDLADAVQAALKAYFADLNQRGGVFGRRIDILFARSPEAVESRVAHLKGFLRENDVFVLVDCYFQDAEAEMAEFAKDQGIPVVGATALFPKLGFPTNRHVFYLTAAFPGQARALARAGTELVKGGTGRAVVLHGGQAEGRTLSETVIEQCRRDGWNEVRERPLPDRPENLRPLVGELKQGGVNAVFFFGQPGTLKDFLAAAADLQWTPLVLALGPISVTEALQPQAFGGVILLSFPELPGDHLPGAMNQYRRLAEENRLPKGHLPQQLSALAAAQVLVEGLHRAGRDLSRESLIVALEGLYDYPTGWGPRISFGPDRRLGSAGAHVAKIEASTGKIVSVAWIEPDRPL